LSLTSDIEIDYLKEYVHFSCTSEDINNLSYALMMHDANKKVLSPILEDILFKLDEMAK
jgi:adenylosuccinate lyase